MTPSLGWREERVSVGLLARQTLGQQEDSLQQHLLVISPPQPEETQSLPPLPVRTPGQKVRGSSRKIKCCES